VRRGSGEHVGPAGLPQHRHQPGLDQRRLAHPRGADEQQQPRLPLGFELGQALHHRSNLVLPTHVETGVLGLERQQAAVWAYDERTSVVTVARAGIEAKAQVRQAALGPELAARHGEGVLERGGRHRGAAEQRAEQCRDQAGQRGVRQRHARGHHRGHATAMQRQRGVDEGAPGIVVGPLRDRGEHHEAQV
jgi:hypothetical protein